MELLRCAILLFLVLITFPFVSCPRVGRPSAEINIKLAEEMLRTGYRLVQIAAFFHITRQTLSKLLWGAGVPVRHKVTDLTATDLIQPLVAQWGQTMGRTFLTGRLHASGIRLPQVRTFTP